MGPQILTLAGNGGGEGKTRPIAMPSGSVSVGTCMFLISLLFASTKDRQVVIIRVMLLLIWLCLLKDEGCVLDSWLVLVPVFEI